MFLFGIELIKYLKAYENAELVYDVDNVPALGDFNYLITKDKQQ
jgi:hypothetical protein